MGAENAIGLILGGGRARVPRLRAPRAGEARMTPILEGAMLLVFLVGLALGLTVLLMLLKDRPR